MSKRQTGRTSRQMLGAPHMAVFVWVNGSLTYPKELAKSLGRGDISVKPLSWLSPKNVMCCNFSGVVLDHAVPYSHETHEAILCLRMRGELVAA